jgi:hypothetical protein
LLEPEPPLVELRIHEEHMFDRFRLRFVLECPDLGLYESHVSDDIESTREAYVADVYRRLETLSTQSQGDFDGFLSRMRDLGAELYERLVPRPIRHLLWNHRDWLGGIEIVSEEPPIPWEIAHLVEPDRPAETDRTRFLGECGLVRWVANLPRAPAHLTLRSDRSWYVIPDYPDPTWRLADAAEERALLEEQLGARAAPPQSAALLDLMRNGSKVDLLHLACHGITNYKAIGNAALMLAGSMVDRRYVPDPLEVNQIKLHADFWRADGVRPIVFLYTRQGRRLGHSPSGIAGLAEAFLRRGAGLLIASSWSAGDAIGLSFSREFYARLAAGDTVTRAVRAARSASKSSHESSWLAYSVYGHPYARVDLTQTQRDCIPASQGALPIPA